MALRTLGPAPCGNDIALVAPLWSEPTRARVRAAFMATGRPYAADTFRRVDATLGKRLDGWAQAHHDTCAATHERHEQSDALLDLRMRCLARARDDAATVIGLLGEADARAVDRATTAVATVADPAPCADVEALTSVVPPPPDPAARREDGAIRLEAGRVLALSRLGQGKAAIDAAHALVPRARTLGQPGALSEALSATALVLSEAEHTEDAITHGYQALHASEMAHDDMRRAESLTLLVFNLGYQQHRFAEALALAQVAESVIDRVRDPPHLMNRLTHPLGAVLEAKGDLTGALAQYVAELGFAVRDTGWPSRPVGIAFDDLAHVEIAFGDDRAQRSAADQAVRVMEATVGPEHPWVAVPIATSAIAAEANSDFEPAAAGLLRAIAIEERAFGPGQGNVAIYLMHLATVRLIQGRLEEARDAAERSVIVSEKNGVEPVLAAALATAATVGAHLGTLDAARRSAQRALDLNLKLDGPDQLSTARIEEVMGEIERRRGDLDQARASLEHAKAAFTKASGADSVITAFATLHLAAILASGGHAPEALALADKAFPVIDKALDSKDADLLTAMNMDVEVLLAAGATARAREVAQRADQVATDGRIMPEVASVARANLAWALAPIDLAGACGAGRAAQASDAPLPFSTIRHKLASWLAHSCGGTTHATR